MITWAHNETSTGVMVPVVRPSGLDDGALVLIDATSGAAGLPVNVADADVYYFAPQKGFASDGGLWLALASPAALERIAQVDADRPTVGANPLDPRVPVAHDGARQLGQGPDLQHAGGSDAVHAGRPDRVDARQRRSRRDGRSAPPRPRATCTGGPTPTRTRRRLSSDPAKRSLVVGTIDFDEAIDAAEIAATLRANGIVDVEPYRKLGRNQLRVAMFPATDPADVQALTACIDWILEQNA